MWFRSGVKRYRSNSLVFSAILFLVVHIGRDGLYVHLYVEGGSVLRILELLWNGKAFFFDLFEYGFGQMMHSVGVNSLDFGFAGTFVSNQVPGFRRRRIASLTSIASIVFC